MKKQSNPFSADHKMVITIVSIIAATIVSLFSYSIWADRNYKLWVLTTQPRCETSIIWPTTGLPHKFSSDPSIAWSSDASK